MMQSDYSEAVMRVESEMTLLVSKKIFSLTHLSSLSGLGVLT